MQDLIRTLPEAVFILLTSGEIVTANPAAAKLVTCDISSLSGQSLADFISTPHDKILHYLHACLSSQEPVQGELSWHCGDGGEIKTCCHGNLLRPEMDETPPLLFLRCELRDAINNKSEEDITHFHLAGHSEELKSENGERQQIEAQLYECEAIYRTILETVQAGIVIINADSHTIVEINPAAAKMIGITKEQIIGSVCFQYFCPTGRDECPITALNFEGDKSERILVRADGTKVPILKSVVPIILEGQRYLIESFVDISERKRVEEKLAAFNRNFEAFLDQTTDFIYFKDINSRFIFCSQPMAVTTGHGNWLEMIGKHDREVFPPDTAKIYEEEEAPVLAEGRPLLNKIDPYYDVAGRLRYVQTNKWPLRDSSGMITGIFGISRDITEHRKTSDALRKSEERLKTAQRIAQIGCWELDLVHNAFDWSDEIYRIFEFDPKETALSYEAFLNITHPDDREAVHAAYINSLTSRTPYTIEHRLLFPDGRIKLVCEQCETLYDADGKALRSFGTVQDITASKKIEENLRVAQKEWERTFDSFTDPIMILDTNHRIVKANKAMANALRVSRLDTMGMTCYQSVHGTDGPPEWCPHVRLLNDGQAHSQVINEPRIGGHFLISVSPLHAADGTLVGSIHAARDITELKKAELLIEKYSYDLLQLLSVSRETTMTTDLASLYRVFVATAKDVLGLDGSSLMLLSDDKKHLTVQDTIGLPASHIGSFFLIEGQGLSTFVIRTKKPETVTDFTAETRFEVPDIIREKNFLSALAVPMMMEDEVFGVLIGHTIARRDFSSQDICLYQQLANQATVAIQNAKNTSKIRKSEKKLRDITASLGEGVCVLDAEGRISFMNPGAEALLGWTEAELDGKNIHDVIHPYTVADVHQSWDDCPIHQVIKTGKRYSSHDEMFIRKNGSFIPVSVIAIPILEDNKVVAAVTSFMDISEIKKAHSALNKANQLLELQACTDSLTGICNRSKFDEMLLVELSRARRHSTPLSILMLDIDHFKNVNDTFGHHIGDIVLQELAANITKNIRMQDCFARWGGEEFILLLPHTTGEQAAQFAENCRVQIEKLRIKGLEGITCSFGVTELRADDNIFSFSKRVDAALYRAKSEGRNRVEVL